MLVVFVSLCLALVGLKPKPNVPRWRRASFATKVCAQGCFPPQVGIPHPIIQGLIEIPRIPDLRTVENCLRSSLCFYSRFRSIPEYSADGSVMLGWKKPVDAATINVLEHVILKTLPSRAELMAYVDALSVQSIRLDRPLWEIHLITLQDGSGAAVVPRIHHAIGDGISLVCSFMKLFTDASGKPINLPIMNKATSGDISQLIKQQAEAEAKAGGSAKKKFKRPSALSLAFNSVGALFKVLSLPASAEDTRTCIKTPCAPYKWNPKRQTVLVPDIPLSLMKAIKNAADCTINDLMTSVVTGSFRRYLEYRNEPKLKQKMQMRALIPFAFPRKADANDEHALRNLWCFLSVHLPINYNASDENSVKRLAAVKRTMDALKTSPEALLQLKVNEIASSVLPNSVSSQTVLDLMTKHSMVFTCVPGPTEIVHVAGLPVTNLQVPIGNIIPQLSAFSYGDFMRFNYVVDPTLFTDAQKLAEFCWDELKALQRAYKC